jgi:hypothetical protein
VTDDRGAIDSGDISIDSTSSINTTTAATNDAACPTAINIAQQPVPPATALAPTSGGGGAIAWYWLIIFLGIALQKKKRSSG